VGTHDGFWAFEMERRGAHEVVAIDVADPDELDWPEPRPELDDPETRALTARRKLAFRLAHQALGSKVNHRYLSVYDLTPESAGEYDFVFIGTLLHHLRDPVGALMAIRRVTRGELLVSAVVSISKTVLYRTTPMAVLSDRKGAPVWQVPNLYGLRRQLTSAGFEVIRRGPPYLLRRGAGGKRPPISWSPRDWRGFPGNVINQFGMPHIGLLARPVKR
jgi:tRNA (mo5U34)-methyltransferase